MTEKKLFEYMELKAMCLMCAAEAAIMLCDHACNKFEGEVEGREFLERRIEEIINIRWKHKDKNRMEWTSVADPPGTQNES